MEEQTQNHSEEEVKDESVVEVDETPTQEVDSDEKELKDLYEDLVKAESDEQGAENSSQTSKENSEAKEKTKAEEQTSKDEDSSESSTKDDEDRQNSLSSKLEQVEKKLEAQIRDYKELQAFATKQTQKLKEIENSKVNEEKQKFDGLLKQYEEQAPELAQMLKFLASQKDKTELSEQLLKDNSLYKDLDEATKKIASLNRDSFQSSLQDFLSRYNYLTNEVSDVLNTLYPTDDELFEAVSKDTSVFDKIKGKVLTDNFDKILEQEKKALLSEKAKSQAQVDSEIAKAKGVGKAKASSSSVEKAFDKMTEEEMWKYIQKNENKFK